MRTKVGDDSCSTILQDVKRELRTVLSLVLNNHELLNAFFSFWISLVKVNVGLGFSHRHLNRA